MKNKTENVSFPACEILRISNCLQNFVKVFKHYQFTLHSHLSTMYISHKYT